MAKRKPSLQETEPRAILEQSQEVNMTTPSNIATDYRVTSLSESGAADGSVSVNFTQVLAEGQDGATYGGFSRVFSAEEGAGFFPGQVYTLTLTRK